MKLNHFVIFAIIIMFLTACNSGTNNNTSDKVNEMPKMVEVEILIPENIQPNEEVTIQARVTQGDEMVDDASEVMFEVWQRGQEKDHDMVESKNDGNGIYSFTQTFEEGFYFVVAHTTARDLHVMPREEFTVGTPSPVEEEEEHSDHNHGHSGGHHHHHADLDIHFDAGHHLHMNEETTLKVTVKKANAALTKATVKFEIWHEGAESREFMYAEEISDGTYATNYIFSEKGKHNINIHIENEDLHEHQLEEVYVD
ncbi:FixH family protein [Bacillus alkalisoli]|uniref:FixH family protein n=1 Tax=Bacillus alkalisoli TaxID=2011008 RepID=UPI000C241365|nr:FixH family protein [Bacillus alkalisoli]